VDDPSFWHRLQFGFTIVYHYLFPQLSMGLAFMIVLWKWQAFRTLDERYDRAARFWAKIFGVNFVLGVVTGVPMEFQFGTNWARFSRYSAGVIGQTLAMEGMFAFFLESAFVAALLFGEAKLSRKKHLGTAVAVWLGSWLSGYFIVTTNAFMQHPVGHALLEGVLVLGHPFQFLFSAWAIVEYAHTMMAAVVTGAFVVSVVGAFYTLRGQHLEQARVYLIWGTRVALVACILVAVIAKPSWLPNISRWL
jgi:cytochrome d ubiquinol oxidase subunit I